MPRPWVAREVLAKLGQPEVPLRQKKITNVTVHCTVCAADAFDVTARNVGTPEHTRQQMKKFAETEAPEETRSTGSRNRK